MCKFHKMLKPWFEYNFQYNFQEAATDVNPTKQLNFTLECNKLYIISNLPRIETLFKEQGERRPKKEIYKKKRKKDHTLYKYKYYLQNFMCF